MLNQLFKSYRSFKDPALHTKYCVGNNEVPYFWLMLRHNGALLAVINKWLSVQEAGEEILSDVYSELAQVQLSKRAKKVALVKSEAKVSLMRLTKLRTIDRFRKIQTRKMHTERAADLLPKEEEFLRDLETKDTLHQIRIAIAEKLGHDYAEILDLLLSFSGELKALAKHLGVDTEVARTRKQRVLRCARRASIQLKRNQS